MASPGLLVDRQELESLFDELAEELGRLKVTAEVVMVGGAWMLWHSLRAATRDVDSARRFDADLSGAVGKIAARHNLVADWLNDSAAAFWPVGTSFAQCGVVYKRETLVVRSPSPDTVFVMKLYRAHPQDREDMVSLWPMCSFPSPSEAVRAYELGYPHAPQDDYLVDYVTEIADDAARGSSS